MISSVSPSLTSFIGRYHGYEPSAHDHVSARGLSNGISDVADDGQSLLTPRLAYCVKVAGTDRDERRRSEPAPSSAGGSASREDNTIWMMRSKRIAERRTATSDVGSSADSAVDLASRESSDRNWPDTRRGSVCEASNAIRKRSCMC